MNIDNLPEKLKELRKMSGLTQLQVANLLGLERSTYSYYETAKSIPDIKTLTKLMRIFDVSYEDLLGVPNITRSSLDVHEERKRKDTVSFQNIEDLSKEEKVLISLYRVLTINKKKVVMSTLESEIKNMLNNP